MSPGCANCGSRDATTAWASLHALHVASPVREVHFGIDVKQYTKIKYTRENVMVQDANFKPDKQVSDLETVMSKNPDIIVSIPTDPVATEHGIPGLPGSRLRDVIP